MLIYDLKIGPSFVRLLMSFVRLQMFDNFCAMVEHGETIKRKDEVEKYSCLCGAVVVFADMELQVWERECVCRPWPIPYFTCFSLANQ